MTDFEKKRDINENVSIRIQTQKHIFKRQISRNSSSIKSIESLIQLNLFTSIMTSSAMTTRKSPRTTNQLRRRKVQRWWRSQPRPKARLQTQKLNYEDSPPIENPTRRLMPLLPEGSASMTYCHRRLSSSSQQINLGLELTNSLKTRGLDEQDESVPEEGEEEANFTEIRTTSQRCPATTMDLKAK